MSTKNNANDVQNKNEKMALDDAARVKVLSPTRLVFKRFIRNKLAIFGLCILTLLFLFCFLGYFSGCGCTTFVMIQGIVGAFVIRIPVAYGLAYLTRTPEFPHGQPIALFSSLMISWTLGMVISIIVFRFGRWKKKMLLQH